jgi:hypothetical protein
MHRLILAAALALLAVLPAESRAQAPAPRAPAASTAGRFTLTGVTDWLKAKGLPATPNIDKDYVVTQIGSETYVVFLGDCKDGGCDSLQFFYGIKYDKGVRPDEGSAAALVNRWNRENRWLKAYVDQDRDVALEMDVWFSNGSMSATADPYFEIFKNGVPIFKKWLADAK